MKRRALVIALLALPLAAQAPKPAEKPDTTNWERKIFQIKHVDPRSIENALFMSGAQVRANYDLKILVVQAPREFMVMLEDAIKKLDVPPAPPKNVDLTFYLLTASRQSSSPAPLPAELQSVAKQLSTVLAYQSFQLMETALIRTRDGKNGFVSGLLPAPSAGEYRIGVTPVRITSDARGFLVRLERLELQLKMPTGQPGIMTDVDLREGQKVVVGKASIDSSDKALILVVSAKVLDDYSKGACSVLAK